MYTLSINPRYIQATFEVFLDDVIGGLGARRLFEAFKGRQAENDKYCYALR